MLQKVLTSAARYSIVQSWVRIKDHERQFKTKFKRSSKQYNSQRISIMQYKADALTVFQAFKDNGTDAAQQVYNEIVKAKQLKLWEAKALSNAYFKLIKES